MPDTPQDIGIPFQSPTTGKVQNVPEEHWDEAVKSGYKPTQHVVMYDNSGNRAMVPKTEESLREAAKQGYNTTPQTPFEKERNSDAGVLGGLQKKIEDAAPKDTSFRGILTNAVGGAMDTAKMLASGGVSAGVDAAQEGIRRGLVTAQQTKGERMPAYASRTAEIAASVASPLVPGLNPERARAAADRGATGELAAEIGVPTAAAVGPALVGGTGSLAKRGYLRMTTPDIPPGLSTEATANMQSPAVRRGVFQLQRAVAKPGNVDFVEKAAIAAPDLGQTPSVKPGAGGVLKPDLRLRMLADNIENSQRTLWQNERMPQIARNAHAPTLTSGDLTAGFSPEEIPRLERELGRPIPTNGNIDLQTADSMRQTVSDTLRKVNQMAPEDRMHALNQDPILEKLDAVNKTLRGKISGVLTEKGEPGIHDFDMRYNAMQEMQDSTRAKLNSAESARAGDNASIRSGGSGVSVLERLHIKPSPGRLVQKGLENFAESGVKPPASVEPPAPTPAIPGVPGTTPPATVAPPPVGETPPPVPSQFASESIRPNQPQAIGPTGQNAVQVNTLPTEHPGEGDYAGLLPGPPAPWEPPAPLPPVPQVGGLPPLGHPVLTEDPMWTGEAPPGVVPTRGPAAAPGGEANSMTTSGWPDVKFQGPKNTPSPLWNRLPSAIRESMYRANPVPSSPDVAPSPLPPVPSPSEALPPQPSQPAGPAANTPVTPAAQGAQVPPSTLPPMPSPAPINPQEVIDFTRELRGMGYNGPITADNINELMAKANEIRSASTPNNSAADAIAARRKALGQP